MRMRERWRRGWCLPSICSTAGRREHRRCWHSARKWGEHGGFPYEASAAALARLRTDEDASEDFFLRWCLAVFARGQEGVFGVREFAGLLDRAVALEAISEREGPRSPGRPWWRNWASWRGWKPLGGIRSQRCCGPAASGADGRGAAAGSRGLNDVRPQLRRPMRRR